MAKAPPPPRYRSFRQQADGRYAPYDPVPIHSLADLPTETDLAECCYSAIRPVSGSNGELELVEGYLTRDNEFWVAMFG